MRGDGYRAVRHDGGMADYLAQKYRALVERDPHHPMSEAARAAVRAEVETTYRRELAERRKTNGVLSRFDLRVTRPTAGCRPPRFANNRSRRIRPSRTPAPACRS